MQGFSKPSGIKPPSQLPKMAASQGRPLAELHDTSANSRVAMTAPSNKHKPSGCKLPLTAWDTSDASLTSSVPEPPNKFPRKNLAERALEYDRKAAAPPNTRTLGNGVKNAVARSFAASTSRINANKPSKQGSVSAYGSSVGTGARIPSNNARPKSAYGQHARSKSHHQGMRPATAMLQQRDEDDEDDRLDRKGVPPFLISTNPKETLQVSRNAHSASSRRPISLNVAPKRTFPLSASRATSSPYTLRCFTPVMEDPADSSCDDICTTLGALELGASEAADRRGRVGRGTIRGKESNPFQKPPISHLPVATPARQTPTPVPVRPPPSTPRAQARFLNRFTNDRCPDFYDDRIEAMERNFAMFKEKMEGDMQQATDYKETIQQLQTKGKVENRDVHDSALTCPYSHRARGPTCATGNGQQEPGVRPQRYKKLLRHGKEGDGDDPEEPHLRDRRPPTKAS